ncbi:MAG: hypothetical protein RIS87_1232 [Pseudomonadota bacterium]
MKRNYLKIVTTLALCIAAFSYYSNSDNKNSPDSALSAQEKSINSHLALTIDTCTGIADKSVAQLSAVVEFQKLEIAGRRIRVMQNCMSDKGFKENPAWVLFTESLLPENVKSADISANEAYENDRRKDMFRYTTTRNKPLYWIVSKQ